MCGIGVIRQSWKTMRKENASARGKLSKQITMKKHRDYSDRSCCETKKTLQAGRCSFAPPVQCFVCAFETGEDHSEKVCRQTCKHSAGILAQAGTLDPWDRTLVPSAALKHRNWAVRKGDPTRARQRHLPVACQSRKTEAMTKAPLRRVELCSLRDCREMYSPGSRHHSNVRSRWALPLGDRSG